jgi:uptake hydrogenase large subunit
MTPGALRQYELLLRPGDAGLSATLSRHGPSNVLELAHGRTLDESVRLAGMFFPICPRAHQAAALDAAEHAAGVILPDGQATAREALVLAEAVAACVWRGGLNWPKLIAAPALHESVKKAREASQEIETHLFEDKWARAGGAKLKIDWPELAAAFRKLSACVLDIARLEMPVIRAAERALGMASLSACPQLGGELLDPGHQPDEGTAEETPRSAIDPHVRRFRPADWFCAQLDHAFALTADLRDRLSALGSDAPVVLPERWSGTGIGIAKTARGRLRHVMSVEDARVSAWRAAAPTDWNFAPQGPVVHYLNGLDVERPEAAASWIVAALDPCAPCSVSLLKEAQYA